MRAASGRSEAPARAAGPRDVRAAMAARRRPFPRTRVAAGAGTVTRVAGKRWRGPERRTGPGRQTTRSRRTRLDRRAAPVTTPVPAGARAPGRDRAPAAVRAPAKATGPARARRRVATWPQARVQSRARARSGGQTGGGPGSRTVRRTGWSWRSRTTDTYHLGCPPGAVRRHGACRPPGSGSRRFALRRHHRSRLSPNRDRSDIPPCAVPFPTYRRIRPFTLPSLCVGGHFAWGNQVSGRAVAGIGAGS